MIANVCEAEQMELLQGYLYLAGSWLIAERFPILFGKHHASISFEKLRVSAYGQDQLIAEFHNIPNSLHLSTFQGIVHLVIGSLGADPITADENGILKIQLDISLSTI